MLTVRAKVADPPSPPLTVSLTVKRPLFFLTTSLSYFVTSVEENFVFSPVVPCVDNTQEPISSLHLFQNFLFFLIRMGFLP